MTERKPIKLTKLFATPAGAATPAQVTAVVTPSPAESTPTPVRSGAPNTVVEAVILLAPAIAEVIEEEELSPQDVILGLLLYAANFSQNLVTEEGLPDSISENGFTAAARQAYRDAPKAFDEDEKPAFQPATVKVDGLPVLNPVWRGTLDPFGTVIKVSVAELEWMGKLPVTGDSNVNVGGLPYEIKIVQTLILWKDEFAAPWSAEEIAKEVDPDKRRKVLNFSPYHCLPDDKSSEAYRLVSIKPI